MYRMYRTISLAMVVSSLVVSSASAQVKLKRQIKENQSRKTTSEVKVSQVLNLAGMEIPTTGETNTVSETSTGKRDVTGAIEVTEKVVSLQVNNSYPGGIEYSFDSANPGATEVIPQLEFIKELHQAVVGTVTTSVYNKSNEVQEVRIDETAFKDLSDMAKALISQQMKPENLKSAAKTELAKIPTQAVSKGDTWERTEPVRLGGGQTMTFQSVYTYEGTVEEGGKKLHKITAKTKSVDLTVDPDAPTPLKVVSSDLNVAESGAVILFSNELGYPIETSSKIRITGDLNVDVNGNQLDGTLDLTMESKSTVE